MKRMIYQVNNYYLLSKRIEANVIV